MAYFRCKLIHLFFLSLTISMISEISLYHPPFSFGIIADISSGDKFDNTVAIPIFAPNSKAIFNDAAIADAPPLLLK